MAKEKVTSGDNIIIVFVHVIFLSIEFALHIFFFVIVFPLNSKVKKKVTSRYVFFF